jgi:hypothetical protein
MRLHPVPLDGPMALEELQVVAGSTITSEGMGSIGGACVIGVIGVSSGHCTVNDIGVIWPVQ